MTFESDGGLQGDSGVLAYHVRLFWRDECRCLIDAGMWWWCARLGSVEICRRLEGAIAAQETGNDTTQSSDGYCKNDYSMF